MKSHAQVVVIGGGVVGCSVLFHLARHGWTDVVLLERDELTSGSTWHAAGGMHTINGDPNVAKLQKYTIELYKEIEELSGQATGVHVTGGVLLAATNARMDWLRGVVAKGRYLGLDLEEISANEAAELMPLIDPKQFVGAVRNSEDGHLDPSGVTHAYAKAARKLGAEVERFTKVEDIVRREDGMWRVITNKGEVIAEHVVNAGGLWAREVGRMVGLELPVLAMEHMYLITEDMPEVKAWNDKTGTEIIHAVDFDGELYLRQERGGMLMGTYEKANKPWSEFATPWNFGHELLEPDIDRIAPSLEVGFRHFPAFQNTGIKQIINGPFTFAPDGNPLVGPVRGLKNFWCACGVMAGFSQGGGVGLALANWMIEGDPGADIWAMDVSRYGDWASMAYTNAKVRENYSRRFSIRFPNEELSAGRPLKTTPIYDLLSAKGAQWSAAYGLEQPLWFAPEGVSDEFSWRRSTDFEHVANEVKSVRTSVGLSEISGFAKYTIKGAGAESWLDKILACKLPKPGRMTLAPMLKDDGRLIGDFSLANLGPDRNGNPEWFIAGSGVAEQYHMRWFEQHLPADGSVRIEALGARMTGLSIAGPKARAVLEKVTRADVSAGAFKFMDIRRMDIGMAPCLVGRISYTGDLGYELWIAPEYQRAVFHTLMEVGADFSIGLFGSRALNALRLEKNYGSWAREYRPIYGPLEAGLDRFVAYSKDADFIGKAAALAERSQGGKLRLRAFIVDADDADMIGDEPIWFKGDVRGWVTSGGYAHNSKASVALGYVPKEIADESDGFEIELLGKRHAARMQPAPLFDANFERMRGVKQPLTLPLDKTAAIFIDLQEEHRQDRRFLAEGFDRVIVNARALLGAARANGVPVFHYAYVADPSSVRPFHPVLADGKSVFSAKDDPLTAICSEVAPAGDEKLILKAQASAFGQGLGRELKADGIEWLVVCGVWTEACVDATVKDAQALGFRVLLVKDACASGTQAMHQTAILNMANRFYGGAIADAQSACRLMAGETVAAWQIEGAVPFRFTFENAGELYDGL